MIDKYVLKIADELTLRTNQVQAVINLLEEGGTVPKSLIRDEKVSSSP